MPSPNDDVWRLFGFAGADVHDVRIRRMDRDVADRRGAVGLEHRLERRAVVLGLEHAADRVADVDDARIAFGHGDVVDASAHAGRTDRSEPECRQQRILRRGGGALGLCQSCLGFRTHPQNDHAENDEGQRCEHITTNEPPSDHDGASIYAVTFADCGDA